MKTYAVRRRLSTSEDHTLCPTDPIRDKALHPSFRKRCTDDTDPLQRPKKMIRLVQSTLDLGSSLYTRCKTCGMTYTPTREEDKQLHARFHQESIYGLLLSKKAMNLAYDEAIDPPGYTAHSYDRLPDFRVEHLNDRCSKGGAQQMYVIRIDRKSSNHMKTIARRVLMVAETELGAPRIEESDLWSRISLPYWTGEEQQIANVRLPHLPKLDRFISYVAVMAQNCIGLCLVERIFRGRPFLGASDEDSRAALQVGNTYCKAKFGISRIWVSRSSRRRMIGCTLLDTAIHDADPQCITAKDEVAFSQPTSLGSKLACKWFGRESGWLLYDEDCGIEHYSKSSTKSIMK